MIILMEALKGGMAELRDCPDFPARLSTAARHARLITEELTGQVALIPFALRALSERRRAKKEGRLVEGVRYGPRERQVADLWLPPRGESDEGGKRPPPPAIAVLFHGGTWTAGDKWHIGPAASYLSERCRCVVVAPNYSTYSAREGLGISASVEDAVDAVRWAGTAATYAGGGEEAAAVGEAAEAKRGSPPPPPRPSPPSPPPRPPRSPPPSSRGGDPTRLAVLGHSAGAHLAVSAALVLAAEREEDGGRGGGGGSPEREPSGGGAPGPRGSHSLPSLVVSLAGPFDLPSHFEHEAKRGVHRLSTMARAAATPGSFALEAAKGGAGEGGGERGRREEPGPRPAAPFFAAAPELHRAALVALSPLACVSPEASLAGLRPAAGPLAGVAAAAAARRARGPERQRGGPRRQGAEGLQENAGTRFLFLSSDADLVVPPSSSAALSAALARGHGGRACSARHVQYSTGGATAAAAGRGGGGEGGRARVRVAGPVGHADFVVRGWGGSGSVPAAPWAAEVEAVVSSL